MTRRSVNWGHAQFRAKSDPEFGQLCAGLTNNEVKLTQIWVKFLVKLTDFRVIVDPEWSLAPMDPFRVKFEPGVFRVLMKRIYTIIIIIISITAVMSHTENTLNIFSP